MFAKNNDLAIEVYQEVLKIEGSADIHYNLGKFISSLFIKI